MIDRTEFPEASPAASRRVFHSKVDTIRPTYGFEDVSLAPGTDTVEPSDVDLTQLFCGIPLEIPILASAMDAVVDVRLAGALARLGGLAVLNLEGVQTRYVDPDAGPGTHRHGAPTRTSRTSWPRSISNRSVRT